MHKASTRFWGCFDQLPLSVQDLAQKNFQLLKENPRHPSLHLKKVGRFWSVRVGVHYSAHGVRDDGDLIWLWIGTHEEYDRLIRR